MVEIVASELTEAEALQLEQALIDSYPDKQLVNRARSHLKISNELQSEFAHLLRGKRHAGTRSGRTTLSCSIQQRGQRFQLRVRHKLLKKPFFFTFATEDEARTYGAQLTELLKRGIVPSELAEQPAKEDPTVPLAQVMRAYLNGCPALTQSDNELLTTMTMELSGTPLSAITYAWAEEYVRKMKVMRNYAPGSIRKRVGALARVLDWHLRRQESTASNPLRLLPRGYSHYTDADKLALAKVDKEAQAKTDIKRDRRLHPGEAEKIKPHLDVEMLLMFEIFTNTGVRLSEGFRLRVDQVDLTRSVLRVEGSKGTRGQIKPRVVPLVPALRPLLAERCKNRVGLLFSAWDGDPKTLRYSSNKLSHAFAAAFRAAGVVDLVAHDLRHEAACRWFEMRDASGRWVFSDIEIARIMGWSSLAMALRYASLRGEDLAARLG